MAEGGFDENLELLKNTDDQDNEDENEEIEMEEMGETSTSTSFNPYGGKPRYQNNIIHQGEEDMIKLRMRRKQILMKRGH